jgi:monothiol glutaredoxin
MDIVERIKAELASSPVVLFMKGTPDFPQCGFSAQTVAALRACGAEFKHVNIFEEPELREALKRYLQLAYVPAALRQWRARGRLRHRP